ncbi:MAG: four helix bundle protein [Patescibacteria group bacterium]
MAEEGKQGTRIAGHQRMIVWKNIDQLDFSVQKILQHVPRNEYKMRSQIDSASDSVGANFVEGYYSGTIGDYIRFLRYGRRSLGEVNERIRRLLRKGYITEEEYDAFNALAMKTMYLFDRLIYSLELKRNE